MRARRATNGSKLRKLTVPSVVILLVVVVVFAVTRLDSEAQRVTPPPAPQPTWTSYIPVTPQVCRDAMDAAGYMYIKSVETNTAAIRASNFAAKGDDSKALDQMVKAQKAVKELAAAEKQYETLAKGCKK